MVRINTLSFTVQFLMRQPKQLWGNIGAEVNWAAFQIQSYFWQKSISKKPEQNLAHTSSGNLTRRLPGFCRAKTLARRDMTASSPRNLLLADFLAAGRLEGSVCVACPPSGPQLAAWSRPRGVVAKHTYPQIGLYHDQDQHQQDQD